MSNPNKDIAAMLRKLARYERDDCHNYHRWIALKKAADAVKHHEERLTSGKEAEKLSGIGPKIAKKIDDFLVNGDDSPMPPSGVEDKAAKGSKKTSQSKKQQNEPETKPDKKVSKKRGKQQ